MRVPRGLAGVRALVGATNRLCSVFGLSFIGVFSATSALEPGVEPEPELAPAKSTPDPEKLAQLHSAHSVGLLSDTELAESLRKIR